MSSYNRKDYFYQKAKKEGFVARSAYKLIELDKRFGILKPGRKIVDLGCAPGGWLQVAEGRLKSEVRSLKSDRAFPTSDLIPQISIIGIDLLPLQFSPRPYTTFIQGDFLDPVNQKKIIEVLGGEADWLLSDMSPNISGVKFKDLQASVELCLAVFEFAKKILKKRGGLVVKIFPGPGLEHFKKELRESFQKTSSFIPEATRLTSTEVYLVSEGFTKL